MVCTGGFQIVQWRHAQLYMQAVRDHKNLQQAARAVMALLVGLYATGFMTFEDCHSVFCFVSVILLFRSRAFGGYARYFCTFILAGFFVAPAVGLYAYMGGVVAVTLYDEFYLRLMMMHS